MGPVHRAIFRSLQPVGRLLCRLWFGLTVEGQEHVPRHGPVVIAANHCSYLDPVVLSSVLPRAVTYLVASDVYRVPFLRPMLWMLGCIPVEQGRRDRGALDRLREELERGGAVGIYPEGAISEDGHLRRGHGGVASLVLGSEAVLVPVSLVGTFEVLPKSARWPRRHPLRVRIGAPLDVRAVVGDEVGVGARRRLVDALMARIEEGLPEHQHARQRAEARSQAGSAG